jgi:hypothetical protein
MQTELINISVTKAGLGELNGLELCGVYWHESAGVET